MASRRAYADEYAVRVNRAVGLLVDRSAADTIRALQAEYRLSERQARRYVHAALERPEGMVVPERSAVFSVRLAPSLIAGLRERARLSGQTLSAATADAVGAYLDQVPRASRWQGALRSVPLWPARARAAGAGVRDLGARAAPRDRQRPEGR